MPMNRTQKADAVDWIGGVFDANDVVVVMRNKGLTVSEVSTLRNDMRAAGGGVKVVKNRLAKIAIKDKDAKIIADLFEGPTVLGFSDDPVTAPKVIAKFIKENEDSLEILGGIMGDTALDIAGITALSKMPSREEILGSISNLLTATHANVVSAIAAPGKNLASIAKARAEREDA